jgi:hypothetical protein
VELMLFSNPADILSIIRSGQSATVPTKPLNLFYVKADLIEKAVKFLKEKSRPTIIDRREEGIRTGDHGQHREFQYQTPDGIAKLTVQKRSGWRPDPEKLEALLKKKNLWQTAQATGIDMAKVEGLCQAGLITAQEMESVAADQQPVYVLIPKFEGGK